MSDYPLVWFWRKWPKHRGWSSRDERRGQRCRVLAYGSMNAALVEMADGSKILTSRYAARRSDA